MQYASQGNLPGDMVTEVYMVACIWGWRCKQATLPLNMSLAREQICRLRNGWVIAHGHLDDQTREACILSDFAGLQCL